MELCCGGDSSDYRIVVLELMWGNGNTMFCIQLKKFVFDFIKRIYKETKWDVKSIVVVEKYG